MRTLKAHIIDKDTGEIIFSQKGRFDTITKINLFAFSVQRRFLRKCLDDCNKSFVLELDFSDDIEVKELDIF